MVFDLKYDSNEEYKDYSLHFKYYKNEIKHSLVNFLRRTLWLGVEGSKLDNFNIIRNTSSFCNEIIEERLSLISTDFDEEYEFTINKFNKSKTDNLIIYSNDITNKDNKKIFENLEICILKPGEELYCKFNVSFGNGYKDDKYKIVNRALMSESDDEPENIWECNIESNKNNIKKSIPKTLKILKIYNNNFKNYLINIKEGIHIINIKLEDIKVEYSELIGEYFQDNNIKNINKIYLDDKSNRQEKILKLIIKDLKKFKEDMELFYNKVEEDYESLINKL
jgi:hypothetical protein